MPFEEDRPPFLYTSIIDGKFVVKAKDDDRSDKIVERVNAEGKTVREYHYRALKNVTLADIKVSKHETYGKSWEIYLIDGNQYICWKQSTKGALGSNFLKMVEGLDLKEPFTIVPGWDKEKEKSQVFVSQGTYTDNEGNKKPKYLKSNYPKPPEGEESPCPMGEVITVNDEPVWDFTKQNRFLWEKVVMSIKPFLPGVHAGMAEAAQSQDTTTKTDRTEHVSENVGPEPEYLNEGPQTSEESNGFSDSEDETDDLPF